MIRPGANRERRSVRARRLTGFNIAGQLHPRFRRRRSGVSPAPERGPANQETWSPSTLLTSVNSPKAVVSDIPPART